MTRNEYIKSFNSVLMIKLYRCLAKIVFFLLSINGSIVLMQVLFLLLNLFMKFVKFLAV
ncbi:hypothetical protein CPTSV76_199 [Enterobacteria phage SV76]|nr:hypothetical protein CPTSV76_199 [Enterobacteria phage SV76]